MLNLNKTLIAALLAMTTVLSAAQSLQLTWDANTDSVTTQYIVYKSINGQVSQVVTTTHPIATVIVARELPGIVANYYVTAKSSQGLESGRSNTVVDNVPVSNLPFPNPVSAFQGTVSVNQGIVSQTIIWSSNLAVEQVTSYVVRRYDENNNLVQTVTTTNLSVPMTWPQATMRTDVTAKNATGEGPIKSFTVQSPRVPNNARLTLIN